MIIKQIEQYANGQLSEQQAEELWIRLLKNPDELQQLAIYLILREFYKKQKEVKFK